MDRFSEEVPRLQPLQQCCQKILGGVKIVLDLFPEVERREVHCRQPFSAPKKLRQPLLHVSRLSESPPFSSLLLAASCA